MKINKIPGSMGTLGDDRTCSVCLFEDHIIIKEKELIMKIRYSDINKIEYTDERPGTDKMTGKKPMYESVQIYRKNGRTLHITIYDPRIVSSVISILSGDKNYQMVCREWIKIQEETLKYLIIAILVGIIVKIVVF